jgi:hypothetical protein
MKVKSRQTSIWCLIGAAAVIAACTTAKPIAEWRDRAYAGDPFDNILIVGISDQVTARRAYENNFVDRLGERQIKATAAFAVMPDNARPTEENIKAVIKDIRFDAVLITHLVGVKEKKSYAPITYRPAAYTDSFYGYYDHVEGYVYDPGYYRRHTYVKLETNLYDARSEALVWSMQSETIDPNSRQKLIDANIKIVVERLKLQGLLPSG